VAVLCRKLGVTRAGYYAWLKRDKSRRTLDNEALLEQIKDVHKESRQTYGYPRVHAALKQQGITCGRHRVARIMRENGILGKKARRFKRHAHRHQRMWESKNLLLEQGEVAARNQVWVGDITFIRVGSRWNYLSVVMDLYSREIIGWAFDKNRSAELVREALLMAAQGNPDRSNLIFHSDQGSEYASRIYMDTLKKEGIQISMSRKGHCWDNAHMESFFQSLKTEMIYFNRFKTLEEATACIMDYIHFYNHKRLHSGIGYNSPAKYQRMAA
jgi:transposase InsO family protein